MQFTGLFIAPPCPGESLKSRRLRRWSGSGQVTTSEPCFESRNQLAHGSGDVVEVQVDRKAHPLPRGVEEHAIRWGSYEDTGVGEDKEADVFVFERATRALAHDEPPQGVTQALWRRALASGPSSIPRAACNATTQSHMIHRERAEGGVRAAPLGHTRPRRACRTHLLRTRRSRHRCREGRRRRGLSPHAPGSRARSLRACRGRDLHP